VQRHTKNVDWGTTDKVVMAVFPNLRRPDHNHFQRTHKGTLVER
jgi:hypothetical protein